MILYSISRLREKYLIVTTSHIKLKVEEIIKNIIVSNMTNSHCLFFTTH